jgi:hypothetical protein
MQGSYGSAIAHIQSGCKILGELEYDKNTKQHRHDILGASKAPFVPLEDLEALFLRLDLSVMEVGFLNVLCFKVY